MASSSKNPKGEEGHEVYLVSNEVKQHKFRPILEVAYKNDLASALSIIPSKVVMVQDVRKFYYKIGAIGDFQIFQAYEKLCENKIVKEEFQIIERKGLTNALVYPTGFKIEWI